MLPPIRLLAFFLLLLAPSLALAEADHDRWYIIEMADQRAGTMHNVQRTDGQHITTSTATRLTIRRGRTALDISFVTEFVETLDGKPVSMKSVQTMGALPTTTEYTFGPAEVTIVTRQGENDPVTTTAPLPEGVWLTPAAASTYAQKRLDAGATEIVARTIDPSMGLQPMITTRRVLERTTAEALGKIVPAIKCSVVVSAMPGMETIEFIDERGVPIRSSSNIGGIPMTILAADRELANAELDPPELMQRTLITPDKPIPNARAKRRASFLLTAEEATAALDAIPATAVQRTEPVGPGKLRIVLNLDEPAAAPAGDSDNPLYLASSTMLATGDQKIRDLAETATAKSGEGAAAAERAEAMRRFVHTFIRAKNLGVGFASASEVARTREGDCTEHATLLAAMLRAGGIPSRAVSGLVYADAFAGSERIFGYHMWTQALLDVNGAPTWVDLDATLGPATPFDATHIALAVTALADDEAHNALVILAPLLGRLKVTVEEAR